MRRFAMLPLIAAFFVTLLASAPAHAQSTRTFVSNTGDDMSTNCSQQAPCRTFAQALTKTNANGIIMCLNPGGYGGLTIDKGLTIACEGQSGGIISDTIIINAGAGNHVILKGLDIGLTAVTTGFAAIKFLSGASLVVENVRIRNFAIGIAFLPNASAKLTVIDSILTRNGDTATANTGGIQISPSASASAKVLIDNVRVVNGTNGIVAIGLVSAQVTNSSISNNSVNGLVGVNGGTIRVGESTITSNDGSATSGAVLSWGDNRINNNGVDTSPASAGDLR